MNALMSYVMGLLTVAIIWLLFWITSAKFATVGTAMCSFTCQQINPGSRCALPTCDNN